MGEVTLSFNSGGSKKWSRTKIRNWSEIYPQLCIFFLKESVNTGRNFGKIYSLRMIA